MKALLKLFAWFMVVFITVFVPVVMVKSARSMLPPISALPSLADKDDGCKTKHTRDGANLSASESQLPISDAGTTKSE